MNPSGNEAHHAQVSADGKYYISGGLLSFLNGKDEIFVWRMPHKPKVRDTDELRERKEHRERGRLKGQEGDAIWLRARQMRAHPKSWCQLALEKSSFVLPRKLRDPSVGNLAAP
jgi:hypothetical protein